MDSDVTHIGRIARDFQRSQERISRRLRRARIRASLRIRLKGKKLSATGARDTQVDATLGANRKMVFSAFLAQRLI